MGRVNAPESLDIAGNRRAVKYSRVVLIRRAFWLAARQVFRYSPRIAFGLRRGLLRIFGAKVGKHVHIYPTAIVYLPWNLEIGDWSALGEDVLIYNLGRVSIGVATTISQRAHLCAGTHDDSDPRLPLLTPPIAIRDQVWVCADAFVGPGVTVGEGAVIGARAVVVKDVEAWDVVAGNPARVIRKRVLRN